MKLDAKNDPAIREFENWVKDELHGERTEQSSTTEASDTATGDDTERLHCLDCNRLANTKCVEQGHRVAASESERLKAASTPPSLIDAAKNVERWWLQLDKSAHGFYGAPGCIFDLRWAIEDYGERKSAPRAGERERVELTVRDFDYHQYGDVTLNETHDDITVAIAYMQGRGPEIKQRAREIADANNQHATLVEQRDTARALVTRLTTEKQKVEQDRERLMASLKRMLNNFLPYSSENTEQYREEYEAYEEAQLLITTIEQSVQNAGWRVQ